MLLWPSSARAAVALVSVSSSLTLSDLCWKQKRRWHILMPEISASNCYDKMTSDSMWWVTVITNGSDGSWYLWAAVLQSRRDNWQALCSRWQNYNNTLLPRKWIHVAFQRKQKLTTKNLNYRQMYFFLKCCNKMTIFYSYICHKKHPRQIWMRNFHGSQLGVA